MSCAATSLRSAALAVSLIENELNRSRKPRPAIFLHRELSPSGTRQGVELGLTPCFRLLPLGLQPSLLFQSVEGGIKRTLIDLNDGFRNLLEPLRDAVAVRRLQGKDLENQHVERALRDRKTGRWHRCLKLLLISI